MKLFSALSLTSLIFLSACTIGQEQVMRQQQLTQQKHVSSATSDTEIDSFDRYATAKQYPKTQFNSVEGNWANDDYQLRFYQSDARIIAVIGDALVVNRDWKRGDVKFLFDLTTEKGLYLMGDRTPVEAKFSIDSAGKLTVNVLSNSDLFSFGKL